MKTALFVLLIASGCCIDEDRNRELGNIISEDGNGKICSESKQAKICGWRCDNDHT